MRLDLFEYEAVPDADPGDGGGDDAATTTPEAVETPPEWSGPSQEEWEQTQQALEYFAQLAQPQFPQFPAEQQPQQVQLDPFSETFQQDLDLYIEQKNAPYQQVVESQREAAGEAIAADILADDIAKNGDFVIEDSKDEARKLAEVYLPEYFQQFPNTEQGHFQAAEAALTQAAADVRAYEQKLIAEGENRYKNQLSGLSGARSDLGMTQNGATQQMTVPSQGGLVELARRFGADNGV